MLAVSLGAVALVCIGLPLQPWERIGLIGALLGVGILTARSWRWLAGADLLLWDGTAWQLRLQGHYVRLENCRPEYVSPWLIVLSYRAPKRRRQLPLFSDAMTPDGFRRLSNSRIDHARAQRSLEAARKKLVAAWGSGVPAFERAVGPFDQVSPIPPVDRLTQEIRGNPDIARWATEKEQRRAVSSLQDAIRIPDPTLAAGVRDYRASGDSAFVAGASIPLPLFNRNQGGILESRRRLAKAERESAAAETKVRAALAETYQALSTAVSEIDALKTTVIPGAESAFEAVSEGYRQGKFGYLDVLDAQRTLFEARGRYVESLGSYHKAVADTERLIGGELGESVKSSETQ